MNWKRKKVLVTGGLGFIGSNLVESLLSKDSEVVVVDCSKIRPSLFAKKLNNYRSLCRKYSSRPQFHDINLQFEPEKFRREVRKAEIVFHLAAYFGGRGFVDKQQTECSAMFSVDQNVFRISLEEGVEIINYASSACVYPNELQRGTDYLLKEEDAGPIYGWDSADNIYGWAKLLGERQLQIMHREKGLKCSSCRYLTVYGPRELDSSHAIAALINRTLRREDPFLVWGSGDQQRGFTFVSDVVQGMLLATEHIEDGTPINLGVNWRVSIRDVVSMIHGYSGFRPKKIVFDKTKPEGPFSRALDLTRVKQMTGWEPLVGIEEGLKTTVGWHKENLDLAKLSGNT